jgi:hypothetical protein
MRRSNLFLPIERTCPKCIQESRTNASSLGQVVVRLETGWPCEAAGASRGPCPLAEPRKSPELMFECGVGEHIALGYWPS